MKPVNAIVKLTPLLAFFLFCAAPNGQAASPPAASRQWNGFVEAFIEAHFKAHPDKAVRAGRHEYDGKLPDWSHAALQRESARLHAVRDQALAFDPLTLDDRQRFERDY